MKLYNKYLPFLSIALTAILSTVILWLPFLARQSHWLGLNIKDASFQYVYRHFDGMLYIIPAKTLYALDKINVPGKGLILELAFDPKYFAAHLPLYPLMIRIFSPVIGYLKSMLFVNLVFTIGLASFFFWFVRKMNISEKPLLLAIVFLFLPRFLVVRSIGAPESLFILLILISLYFFENGRFFWAGISGALAVTTKTPGILLFGAYLLSIAEKYLKTKKADRRWLWLLLIPGGLLTVFLIYQIQYGDFWAYFHTGGVVPMPYPFSAFNWQAKWVGTAWIEEIVFYFFIYILTAVTLFRSKYRSLFYFSVVFLIATIFVQHRDISRYSLPLWPLACVAFEKHLTSKKWLLALLIILPAIYFYAWNFMSYNVMPVSDWSPFL